jgi:hypothetical protein
MKCDAGLAVRLYLVSAAGIFVKGGLIGMGATSSALESSPAPETGPVLRDECWELAQRVASSDIFSKSELLRKFLLHVCELYLHGRTDEIKEQEIGVHVFDRPHNYNPGDDNIVRNYAVQLRKRLHLYFEREGWREDYRIDIPKGAYVPVFQPRKTDNKPLPVAAAFDRGIGTARELGRDLPITIVPPPTRREPDWKMFFLGTVIGTCLLAGILLWGRGLQTGTSRPLRSPHPLWSTMFVSDRDTFIVPADSGLGILQNLTEESATLDDYASGKYLSKVNMRGVDAGNLEDLRSQRYTSMADLVIATRLSHLPDVVPGHLIIRYARDLRIDDLKTGNAILLGAIHTDPWVGLLQEKLNFQFVCGKRVDDCFIHNAGPLPGELSEYKVVHGNSSRETYAIIALLPNLDGTGRILLIEGLNMAGTEAAANMLLDDSIMRPVLEQAKSPAGTLKPFELLIETGSLGAQALPARIVAFRNRDNP